MNVDTVSGLVLGLVVGYLVATIWYHHRFSPLIAYFEASEEYAKLKGLQR